MAQKMPDIIFKRCAEGPDGIVSVKRKTVVKEPGIEAN